MIRYNQYQTMVTGRDEALLALAEAMERKLTIVGVTGIEDKLQVRGRRACRVLLLLLLLPTVLVAACCWFCSMLSLLLARTWPLFSRVLHSVSRCRHALYLCACMSPQFFVFLFPGVSCC